MPEGPEVKVIGTHLNRILSGATLKNIQIHGGRYETHGVPDGWDFMCSSITQDTEDVKIVAVHVKGKLLYWEFSNGWYLLNTLGMSGTWRKTKSKHCDVSFEYFQTGDFFGLGEETQHRIYFKDQRHFGTLKFVNSQDLSKKLKKIGPDVLTDDITPEMFQVLCKKYKHWTLAKLLMNQSKISGIGNYLKCEILYASKISPHRKLEDLNQENIETLIKYCKKIPLKSLASQGVSIRDYAAPDGEEGTYQFSLKVYMKKVDPKGNKVITEKTEDKRTTHWVPSIQV